MKNPKFSYLDKVRDNEERKVETYELYGETLSDEVNEEIC